MGRIFLIGAQLTATILFVINFDKSRQEAWLSWFVPMVLIVLVAINSFWFTRLVAWIIFALAFFAFLVCLSAFTIRWRVETGFHPAPFYRTMMMYIAFVYVSLGQIKLQGGSNAH